jgi:hypothetical protein
MRCFARAISMNSNTKNLAIVFLAATTLGLGVQLYSTRQKLAAALNAPKLEVKHSEVKVAAAPSPISAPAPTAAAPAAEAQQENNFGPPEGGPGSGPGNFGGRGGRGFGAQMAELMKDPEFAAAMKLEQEARIDQRYGALFKQLNLPAEKIAELKSMLAERENAMRDVMASAAAQGLNPRESRDELRQLAADMQAEVDNAIKTTFGDSVLTSINTFNDAAPQRSTINDLSQKLVYSSQPLNDTQSRMLTTILAETGQQNGRTTLITDATIARAQGVLMPSQVAALKKLQSEQQAQQLLQAKMREAREKAQAARNAARQE